MGKLLQKHTFRLMLLIVKTIINGKRFVKIHENCKSFPLKCFAMYVWYNMHSIIVTKQAL